jgi:methionyl-tRNA formyltransferase
MSTQRDWEQIAREMGPEVLAQIALAAIRQAPTQEAKDTLAQRCRRALIRAESETDAPAAKDFAAAAGPFRAAWQKVEAATK